MPPLVLDGTNGVSGVDGTASNPAIEGTDSNTGIFYPAADTVAIGTGGTEALRVNSSQNVGIGTNAPANILDVSKQSGTAWLTAPSTISAAGENYFNISVSGKNSAGTAYEAVRLGFSHDVSQASAIRAGAFTVSTHYAGTLTERLRIDSSGNVGIGTSSPGEKLTVSGSGAAIAMKVQTTSSNAAFVESSANSGACVARLQANPTEAFVGTLTNSNFYIYTNGTERARINSAGYSKFSDNGTYLGSTNTFHEFRQSANDVTLIVHGSNTSQTDNVMYVRASRNTTNNTFYAFGYYNDAAAAYKMRVADSGTITNTTGTYTTISDIKLKQDIVDASSQWDDIKALRIVKYRLKEYVQNDPDSKPFLGLIAQEVEQVCPSLVEEQEDEVMDEDGKLVKNGEVTKGVKTSILYMKAVKALQEAMARIEQLEAKVAALESA